MKDNLETTSTKNIIDKIWDQHVVMERAGHPAIFFIDFMLIHEVTSAQAFQMLETRGLSIADKGRLLATLDHSIPTRLNRFEIYDETARKQVETLRNNVKRWGVPFYDFDSGHQGIVHVVGPELGITQPGMTIVCGDSHTSTHGAFGALGFGIGTSEVGHVLATSTMLLRRPKTMLVSFNGAFKPGVYAKDAILKLISRIGIAGGNGHIIEYAGEAIRNMSMAERMTVCNMSIECGARAGLVAPDQTTFDFLKGKQYAPTASAWDAAVERWSSLASDPLAFFDKEIEIPVQNLKPMITWGTNPEQALEIDQPIPNPDSMQDSSTALTARKSLDYVGLKAGQKLLGTSLDYAFIGSCTNGRIEDLRIAASILKGKKVKDQVTCYIVPGSEQVRQQAIQEGLDRVFTEAGAQFRMPGCSMCLGMNDDLVPAGKRCISSSNRNFVGRQGPGSITHLASPATVAASAINGVISSAEEYL